MRSSGDRTCVAKRSQAREEYNAYEPSRVSIAIQKDGRIVGELQRTAATAQNATTISSSVTHVRYEGSRF